MDSLKMTVPFVYSLLTAASQIEPQLEPFFRHPDARVRARVAEHPRLPVERIFQFAADGSPEVRISISDNPSTPLALVEVLSQDDHPDVRYAIAENANTPLHLLKDLLNDENPYVAFRAGKTLQRMERSEALELPIPDVSARNVAHVPTSFKKTGSGM
jgi:hypothetical protein